MSKNTNKGEWAKFDFKFRLDRKSPSNEFMNENIIFVDMKDCTIQEIVKLLNITLKTAGYGLRIRQPNKSNFELFNPEENK